MTIDLTKEQRTAYDRYIRARDRVFSGSKWVRQSSMESTVDIQGYNHPFFVVNDAYKEYVEAFQAWLDIEPKFRDEQRMRSTRGDYGLSDNWEDKTGRAQDTFTRLGGEGGY